MLLACLIKYVLAVKINGESEFPLSIHQSRCILDKAMTFMYNNYANWWDASFWNYRDIATKINNDHNPKKFTSMHDDTLDDD